jgi:hypothetical protein
MSGLEISPSIVRRSVPRHTKLIEVSPGRKIYADALHPKAVVAGHGVLDPE